jgi:hypothetical protein
MFSTQFFYLVFVLGAYGQVSTASASGLSSKLNSTALISSIGKTNSTSLAIGATDDDASILKSLETDEKESFSLSSSPGGSLSSAPAIPQTSSGTLPSASQLADEYITKLTAQFKKKLDETFNTFTFNTSDTFKLTKEEARDLFVNDLPDEVIPGFRPKAFEAFEKLAKASIERPDLADGLAKRIQGHLKDQWTEYSKPRIAKWMKDHPDFVEQIKAVPMTSTSSFKKSSTSKEDDEDLDLDLRKRNSMSPAALALAIVSIVLFSLWLVVDIVFIQVFFRRKQKVSTGQSPPDHPETQQNQKQNMVPEQVEIARPSTPTRGAGAAQQVKNVFRSVHM